MYLTDIKNEAILKSITAKSVSRIGVLRTSAKALTRSAFFMPIQLWWAVWSYLRVDRSRAGNANSEQSATQSIGVDSGGSQTLHEDTTMSLITIASKSIRELDGFYSLNDLHKASGGDDNHTPNRFLRNAKIKELITEIEQTPNLAFAIKTKRGGKNGGGTYAHKYLVYAYAMWISPKFHLHVIKAFDAQQTQQPKITQQTECNDPANVCMPKEYLDFLYFKIQTACANYNTITKLFDDFKDSFHKTHDSFVKLNAVNELTQLSPTFKTMRGGKQ